MTVAAVVLAAGLSRRFGPDDKLAASLGGLPLAAHIARALAPLPLASRIVVTRADSEVAWAGFEAVVNERPEDGMGHSLALGIAVARRLGAGAALVVLADMPFVTTAHLRRLLAWGFGPDKLVASSDGARRTPPALFGSGWFALLETLTGDHGARDLLVRAEIVQAGAEELADIDLPGHLAERRGSAD